MLGGEILALAMLSIKASPEMAKAMQAEAREKLLVKADEAVFARRSIAPHLKRQVKENELPTERAVEEKRREVRQAQMQADNHRKLAAAQTEVFRATLERLRHAIDLGFPVTPVDRRYLANFDFRNVLGVVVLGPDGLVANTPKYAADLPIIGVNPVREWNDGRSLLTFNDFFIGRQTHVSARYTLHVRVRVAEQRVRLVVP